MVMAQEEQPPRVPSAEDSATALVAAAISVADSIQTWWPGQRITLAIPEYPHNPTLTGTLQRALANRPSVSVCLRQPCATGSGIKLTLQAVRTDRYTLSVRLHRKASPTQPSLLAPALPIPAACTDSAGAPPVAAQVTWQPGGWQFTGWSRPLALCN